MLQTSCVDVETATANTSPAWDEFLIHRLKGQLRESEERYQVAIQATNDGIWDWDLETGKIHSTPRCKTLLGLPFVPEISSPDDWIEKVHPDDIPALKQAIRDHLQLLTTAIEREIRVKHHDGNYRWMLCRGLAQFDAQNKPYRITGSISDITAHKKSIEEENIRRKEAELLHQALVVINSSLNLQDVLDHIMVSLEQVIPFDSAALSLIDGDFVKISALAGTSRHTRKIGERVGKNEGLFSLMGASPLPVVLGDAQTHPKYEQWSEDGKDTIHSWMGVSLVVREKTIGYLMFNSAEKDIFTPNHSRLAQAFANQAAVAIENARLFEQVRRGRERLQVLSRKMVEIQEEERKFIAHEMHDEIGQVLTGLQFILMMGKQGTKTELLRTCTEAQNLVAGLIAQVRELSTSLHPSMLDDLGLLPALNAHFERFQGQTGIQTRFQHENLDRRFSPEVEISAFRLIQEALTNVARYAAVKQVEVNISANENCLQIQVMDHGRGFDVEMLRDSERSFGLSGIRERTYLVGGTFDIVSRPNEGTRITATFPTGDRLERRKYDRANSVSR